MPAAAIRSAAPAIPSTEAAGELLVLEGIGKRFPGVDALVDVDFEPAGRGSARPVRRKRRRKIDAHLHRSGGGAPDIRDDEAQRREGGIRLCSRSTAEGHQRGLPGILARPASSPSRRTSFSARNPPEAVFLDKTGLHRRAVEILERLDFPIKPTQRVAYLSRAEQQMVEIAKAFRSQPSILIFDEPTASLTERETDRLFAAHRTGAETRGRHHLHHPPDGRDPPHREPHHGIARRPQDRDARRQDQRRRPAHRADDRPGDFPGVSDRQVRARRELLERRAG